MNEHTTSTQPGAERGVDPIDAPTEALPMTSVIPPVTEEQVAEAAAPRVGDEPTLRLPAPSTPAAPAEAPAEQERPATPAAPATETRGEPTTGRAGAPYVTIVLPCFNEAEHVLQEIDRISKAMEASEFTYEILCIDDASTDDTLQVLHDAATRYPHIRVMPFRRNGGSGTARRIGTQQAHGEIVVWTDADMTYENERIPELVRILRDDDSYDQVVGARTTEEGTHKWARVPAKWLIRKIAEKLSNEKIPDLNSGLRAFRREVSLPYLRLLPPGFSCVTTITLAFLHNQHDIKYVPTSYAKRAGVSKFHFVRDAYRYILQVLRMVMYFNPLKVLLPPALWMVGIGLVKAVVDMFRHPFYFPAGTVLLVVSGLMIGSLALLADLVVRSRDGV